MNTTINETVVSNITLIGQNVPLTGSPSIDIFLITLVIALFTTLVNKHFTDQVAIKASRAEMKELQKKMRKEMTKNPEKAKQLQSEIMKKNLENMKHSMNLKVMLITMGPLLFIFTLLPKYYGHFGEFFTPFGGIVEFGWLGTYILFSIINSMALKKVLDVA